ncbi:hypothetical protein Bhyg_06930, partial [Pseudolycoriella hygida]
MNATVNKGVLTSSLLLKLGHDGQNRTPRALDCANIATEWPKWKQNFLVWMIATGKNKNAEKDKIATFIWLLGEQGTTIYNTLYPNDGSENSMLGVDIPAPTITNPNEKTQRTLQEVLVKFDNHCVPLRNVAMESYKFNMIFQKQYQSFAEFETELRKQMQYCAYKCSSTTCQATFDERMLRDRIIVGVYDKKLQLKLLDGRNESLADVIDKCKVFEIVHQHKNILDDKSSTVASIASDIQANINALDQPKRVCFNCGQLWQKEHVLICKAKYAMCRKCTKKGHFAVMCRQMDKKPHQTQSSNGKINLNKQTVGTLLWSDITVVSNEFEPILGLYTCVELGIVKRADIGVISLPHSTESFLEQYKDVFTGCGKFPGEYKIYLKENSKPVVHYRKRIPHALLSPLKIELDKMLQGGIISRVDYPTDWVHNLQIHEKSNGKLRICLDPKPLNNCIKREHFLIPTIQDLMSCLAYSTVF